MEKRIRLIKRIWRSLLKKYYRIEKDCFENPDKLERLKRILSHLPIDKNKIVFDNMGGKGYGDNPKYIAEELLKDAGKYKIIWLTNNDDYTFPAGITPVHMRTLRAYYEVATAKEWVTNVRVRKLTEKRNGQVLLQTWHAGQAMKKIEGDAEDKISVGYIQAAKVDGKECDGIIIDGKQNEDIFQRAFWLNPRCELLRYGSPRTDILINEKNNEGIVHSVKDRLGIRRDSFVALYAPTFRQNHNIEAYINDYLSLYRVLESRFPNVTIAVRFHPNMLRELGGVEWNEYPFMVNATKYPDSQELAIASDCLITDYSSIAFDFAILNKPVFLYQVDQEAYIQERGVYPLFYDMPFAQNRTFEELLKEISSFSQKEMKERIQLFYSKYPNYNKGSAARQTVEWLKSKGLKARQ